MFGGNPARTGQQPGPGPRGQASPLWKFQTGGAVASSPAVFAGVVYAGSQDGTVYAVDATTGTERWHFATGGPVASSPAVDAASNPM